MNTPPLQQLRQALDNLSQLSRVNLVLDDHAPASTIYRLLHALAAPEESGPRDIVALTRQLVLKHQGGENRMSSLKFPLGEHWPTPSHWEEAGFSVAKHEGGIAVSARHWSPDWLGGAPFQDAIQAERRRSDLDRHRIEPVITEVLGERFQTYSCDGQRRAMRAAFLSKPGSTLLVMLPTGSGKSLVYQAPALVRSVGLGVTVVVVPTTALALDQERAILAMARDTISPMPYHLAYHSALDDEVRRDIRAGIRSGSQRIVIASPESLTQSLRPALYHAAREGLLRYLVLDEAHMASSWGTGFRPHFQSMAGLRRGLLRACLEEEKKFRTLLLTATLGQEGFDLLQQLFADPGPFDVISSNHLRPEPSYWYTDVSEEEHVQRVLEVCRHAPRPFILYTSLRTKNRQGSLGAKEWLRLLRDDGFQRVDVVHGESTPEQRLRVIQHWRQGEVDAVVGTSSFGLGIDLDNVRAVIHACIPETIERYYQEVGRGGRDGRACSAVLVAKPSDYKVAQQFNDDTVIGAVKGSLRWKAMWMSRKDTADLNIHALDLDAIRERLPEERTILSRSKENQLWNLRTATLLARAQMVDFQDNDPQLDDQDKDLNQPRIHVSVSNPGLLSEFGTWQEGALLEASDRIKRAKKMSLQSMKDLLACNRPAEEILRDSFILRDKRVRDPVVVCGGCPACRERNISLREYTMPWVDPLPPENTYWSISSEVKAKLNPNYGPTYIFMPPGMQQWRGSHKRKLRKALKFLIGAGFCELGAPEQVWSLLKSWRQFPEPGILLRGDMSGQFSRYDEHVPRISVFLEDAPDLELIENIAMLDRPLHVILLSESTPDPWKPSRRLLDITPHRVHISHLEPDS
jgi:superfamily II DNA/RNA helicase